MTPIQSTLANIGVELDCLRDLMVNRCAELGMERLPDGSRVNFEKIRNMTATEKIRLGQFLSQFRA